MSCLFYVSKDVICIVAVNINSLCRFVKKKKKKKKKRKKEKKKKRKEKKIGVTSSVNEMVLFYFQPTKK